ncbi:MAG: alkyl hydroperoxide reductase [Gammaproteobacteria bacterium]|jgi:alkyl hydroperoxide reductase subunit D|nr:alkyl hydroperoxide reductase [Gammaproteobacteria bacterium]
MNFDTLKNKLPDFAKDTKLNLSSLLNQQDIDGLSAKQIAGIALASAYSTKQAELINAIFDYANAMLTETDIQGIKIATSLMAMNNIYYRFIHLASDKSFASMPAKLRMNGMANPGIDKVDFELYALAVSAINGCGMCMDSHVKSLVQHQVSHEAIQTCIRVSAVVNAVAQTLNIP